MEGLYILCNKYFFYYCSEFYNNDYIYIMEAFNKNIWFSKKDYNTSFNITYSGDTMRIFPFEVVDNYLY